MINKKLAHERQKKHLEQYKHQTVIERNFSYYIMLICSKGKEDVIKELLNFVGIKYNSDCIFKTPNHLLCDFILSSINNNNETVLMSKRNNDKIYNLLELFHIICLSLYNFEQQYTKENETISFFSNIIVNCIKNGYCYAWYGNYIKKFSIKGDSGHIQLLNTYSVTVTDKDFIKLKGIDESISIKKFIKTPSRKTKNIDYQRYSVFYNFVHNIVSDKNGKYCPYCNPFGRKDKSKKTGKDAVIKGCPNCSVIFNKVNVHFKAKNSSRRFLDNLRKDILKEIHSKQEFYAKRLEDLDKSFKKELIKNGYIQKQNYKEITEGDLKLIPEKVLAIKRDFEKRFTIED